MKNGSILIISNDSSVADNISNKIKLLRECDEVKIVSVIESISLLNTTQPSLIILYATTIDGVGIVKEIRAIKSLDKVPIIFVMDSLNEEILCHAFDNGIDDFFFTDEPDSIILMRIFLTLNKSILYKQIDTNNEILISAGILDKYTGVYTKENAKIVLRNFFEKSIEENQENTVFMYIKPAPRGDKKLSHEIFSIKTKSVLRKNDIVANAKGFGLYLILYNCGVNGAKSVAKRLKNALADTCKIYVNAAEITKSFEEMEPVIYSSMNDQINAGIEFNYLYELNINEAIEVSDIKDERGKKFKDFKKEFLSNFEKLVAPVFFQIQTKYNEAFPNAEIKFNINEISSSFSISQNDITSELLITYPTYIKLILDIKHTRGRENPEVRRIVLDFEDFSEERLASILKDIINEFSTKINIENPMLSE